jgi:hypothetical protein
VSDFSKNLNFLVRFFKKNTQIPNFIEICPLGAELSHADGLTDISNEAYIRLFEILLKRLKTCCTCGELKVASKYKTQPSCQNTLFFS